MPPPVKVRRKKKVGRPAFSRKDIPRIFFTYFDAYKYGFWTKQDMAYIMGVSRPTLDRYFKTIKAKPPIVTRAENKKLQKQYNVGESIKDKLEFYYQLKEMHGENTRRSTGAYGVAFGIQFRLRLAEYQTRQRLAEMDTAIDDE